MFLGEKEGDVPLPTLLLTLLCRACSGTVNYCLPPLSVSHESREFTSLSTRISWQNVDIAFRWSALGSSSVSWLPQYHSVHYFIFASVAVPCSFPRPAIFPCPSVFLMKTAIKPRLNVLEEDFSRMLDSVVAYVGKEKSLTI